MTTTTDPLQTPGSTTERHLPTHAKKGGKTFSPFHARARFSLVRDNSRDLPCSCLHLDRSPFHLHLLAWSLVMINKGTSTRINSIQSLITITFIHISRTLGRIKEKSPRGKQRRVWVCSAGIHPPLTGSVAPASVLK